MPHAPVPQERTLSQGRTISQMMTGVAMSFVVALQPVEAERWQEARPTCAKAMSRRLVGGGGGIPVVDRKARLDPRCSFLYFRNCFFRIWQWSIPFWSASSHTRRTSACHAATARTKATALHTP